MQNQTLSTELIKITSGVFYECVTNAINQYTRVSHGRYLLDCKLTNKGNIVTASHHNEVFLSWSSPVYAINEDGSKTMSITFFQNIDGVSGGWV